MMLTKSKSLPNVRADLYSRSSTVKTIAMVDVTIVLETDPILPIALTGGLVSTSVGTGASETGNPTVGKEAKAADGWDVAPVTVGDVVDELEGDVGSESMPLGPSEGDDEGTELPLGLE